MKHVLVVEDDALNATLFRMILEKHGGFRVTITESPEKIFELTQSGDVAIVVMDISLANSRWQGQSLNGVDLCRMLKEDPRTEAIPVMLATAHAMRGDAEKLLAESGADGYVSKPILDHHLFVAQVRALMKEAA